MESDMCLFAELMSTEPLYLFPLGAGMVTSIVTIICVIYLCCAYGGRIYYHPNVKLLLVLNIFWCVSLAVTVLLSYGLYFVNLYNHVVPCDLLFLTSKCSAIRQAALTSFAGITITHFSLIIERVWATIRLERYEKDGCALGLTLCAITVFLSWLVIHIVLTVEVSSEILTNCLSYSTSPVVGPRMYLFFQVQLGVGLFILAVYIYLHYKNKRYSLSLNLNTKFQQYENVVVLAHLAPLVIANCSCVAFYIITASIFRMFMQYMSMRTYKLIVINIFFLPHISTFLAGCLLYMIRKSFKEKEAELRRISGERHTVNHGKEYFTQYSKQWDQVYETRTKVERKAGNMAKPLVVGIKNQF